MFLLLEDERYGCFVFLQVPFPVLQGEGVEYLGHADEAIIAISNYRLHIKYKDSVINVSASRRQTHRRTLSFPSVHMAWLPV